MEGIQRAYHHAAADRMLAPFPVCRGLALMTVLSGLLEAVNLLPTVRMERLELSGRPNAKRLCPPDGLLVYRASDPFSNPVADSGTQSGDATLPTPQCPVKVGCAYHAVG